MRPRRKTLRRRSEASAAVRAIAIGVIGFGAAGFTACRAEAGHVYGCTCSFLTDFDDASKTDVSVCAPTAERAVDVARGCAQSAAPAPIQSCTCATPAESCPRMGCR